jgi:sulfopyruvate decarboxylase alpha subunit
LTGEETVSGKTSRARSAASVDWPAAIYRVLKSQRVRQVSYVPDAGHKRLIELCHADKRMAAVPLTSEEEGIGLAAGAWLGGERAALLMQSSGVGNCVNAFTLAANCKFPLLMLITMRGEEGELNPWQIPMGRATPEALRLGGVRVFRLDHAADAPAKVSAAARLAFEDCAAVAVTISQSLIGIKSFEEKP